MSEEALKEQIAELEATIQKLEKDLIHDSLTGLKTRAFFNEEARIYIDILNASNQSRRKKWFGFKELSFIFIDIDHFKKINDDFGHLVGDEVLKSVAQTVKMSVRDGDTAARWGGEEIVVTLVGASEKDALNKAEEIRKHVESTKFGKWPELKVTVSLGVASVESGLTIEEVLKRADKALYSSKLSGRNKVTTHSELS